MKYLQSNGKLIVQFSLNLVVEIVFMKFEYDITGFNQSVLLDIICLLLAFAFTIALTTEYFKKWKICTYLLIKANLSVLFYQIMVYKRLFMGDLDQYILYYIFGFLSGQYSSEQIVIEKRQLFFRFKVVVQAIVLTTVFAWKLDHVVEQSGSEVCVLLFINIFLIAILDIYMQMQREEKVHKGPKQPSIINFDNPNQIVQEAKFTQKLKLKTRSSKSNMLWEDLVSYQLEEWFCKMQYSLQYQQSEILNMNASLQSFFSGHTLNAQSFLQRMIIINSQQMSHKNIPDKEQVTLDKWIQSHIDEFQRAKAKHKTSLPNLYAQNDEQSSVQSPQNKQFIDKVIDLSAIQSKEKPSLSSSVYQYEEMLASNKNQKIQLQAMFVQQGKELSYHRIQIFPQPMENEQSITFILFITAIDKIQLAQRVAQTNLLQQQIEQYDKLIRKLGDQVNQVFPLCEEEEVNRRSQDMQFQETITAADDIKMRSSSIQCEEDQKYINLMKSYGDLVYVLKEFVKTNIKQRINFKDTIYTHSLVLTNTCFNYLTIINTTANEIKTDEFILDDIVQNLIKKLLSYQKIQKSKVQINFESKFRNNKITSDLRKFKQLLLNLLMLRVDQLLPPNIITINLDIIQVQQECYYDFKILDSGSRFEGMDESIEYLASQLLVQRLGTHFSKLRISEIRSFEMHFQLPRFYQQKQKDDYSYATEEFFGNIRLGESVK